MTNLGDDTVGVDVSRRPTTFELIAAIVSSIIAAIVGWYLFALFAECGIGDASESYGWIKLIVGTCFLAPGIIAAIVTRTVSRPVARTLAWVTFFGAFPLFLAWLSWLDRFSGCAS